MKRTGSSIPTDKGSPCLPWPCKVMPQAVFGKIILATAAVFSRKTLHSRDTAPSRSRWDGIPGIRIHNNEKDMNLNNAEIAVTTQHLIDIKNYRDYWLHMSDYSDMGEFLCACSDLFPGEEEPQYRYPKWENIPDILVSREWLCPNFFEIRDALERLEEEETEFFMDWSRNYGYDISTDDPHMIVSHYHDLYGDAVAEKEEDTADLAEDTLIYTGISSSYCDMLPFRYEIFDDNYN